MRSTRYSPVTTISSSLARSNRAKPVVSMNDLTERSVAAFYGQEPSSNSRRLQRQDNDELLGERRSGDDRRSQNRREDRQSVWLDTRSGQDRRRQHRRAGDSIHVVSLKI